MTVTIILPMQIGNLLGMPGPFIVHSLDTFTVCNSTATPRSSPAFLDWQARTYQQMLYYLMAQAIAVSILVPISFCERD